MAVICRNQQAPGKIGAVLGAADGFAANSFVELDVTGAVAGNGTAGFYLEMPACTTDTKPTRFNSDEASSNKPQLVVTTAGTTPPQCSDGLDNDGDGITDFPDDPGCSDAQDNDETDPAAGGVMVAAAGDIACDPNSTYYDGSNPTQCQHRRTDDLLAGSDAVLTLGDLQYPMGRRPSSTPPTIPPGARLLRAGHTRPPAITSTRTGRVGHRATSTTGRPRAGPQGAPEPATTASISEPGT